MVSHILKTYQNIYTRSVLGRKLFNPCPPCIDVRKLKRLQTEMFYDAPYVKEAEIKKRFSIILCQLAILPLERNTKIVPHHLLHLSLKHNKLKHYFEQKGKNMMRYTQDYVTGL